jgi:hypothetical protein
MMHEWDGGFAFDPDNNRMGLICGTCHVIWWNNQPEPIGEHK